MIKRIISLLLIISMLFVFAACNNSNDYEETKSTTESIDDSTNEDVPDYSQSGEEETSETTTQVPTVKVTIPEGYTLVRISWLLEENGFCTSEEFLKTAQNYKDWLDLSQYPFLNSLQSADNVCFYLEGYIFPLTYDIPENATAQDIIKIFLNGTKQRLNDAIMTRIQQTGFSVHEILTLASLIEKEAKLPEQRAMISSVLHNRIDAGMQFQCDPTVKYCTGVIELIYPGKIDHFKYYYNTYRCKGLMAGPICNPGMRSIEAAISPANTEYLYFIIGTVPPYEAKYSLTFKEHDAFWNANKDRLTGA